MVTVDSHQHGNTW